MKRKTIRNHKDFFVPKDGIHVAMDCFLVKAKPAKIPGDARYGLIVSKKTFKLAVHRNRAKRLIRNWIAENEGLMLPDLDYIFIVRNTLLDYDHKKGSRQIKRALSKISKIYNQDAKESC